MGEICGPHFISSGHILMAKNAMSAGKPLGLTDRPSASVYVSRTNTNGRIDLLGVSNGQQGQ